MNLWQDKDFPIIVSCAKTLAPWTEKEIVALGYKPIDKSENYVVVKGALRDVFKLNLWLRTAQRVFSSPGSSQQLLNDEKGAVFSAPLFSL